MSFGFFLHSNERSIEVGKNSSQKIEIGPHTKFIGKIVDLKAEDDALRYDACRKLKRSGLLHLLRRAEATKWFREKTQERRFR